MKAEKFSPSPTGSRIVKRTLPGGIAVSIRSMMAWMAWTALARPSPAAFSSNSESLREGKQQGQRELALRRPQPRVFGHAAFDPLQPHVALPEADRRRDLGRRRPVLPKRGVPRGEEPVAARGHPLRRRPGTAAGRSASGRPFRPAVARSAAGWPRSSRRAAGASACDAAA